MSMYDKQRKLLELKKKIEDAKAKIAKLQGQEQLMLRQLKEDWGCEGIGQAESKINSMEEELRKLENSIQEAFDELMEKFNL